MGQRSESKTRRRDKDLDLQVNHDLKSQTNNDQHLMVGNQLTEEIGNNQDYLGNGLTKDLNPNSPNNFGAVETLNFERREVNFKQLLDAGAINIITGLTPL